MLVAYTDQWLPIHDMPEIIINKMQIISRPMQ